MVLWAVEQCHIPHLQLILGLGTFVSSLAEDREEILNRAKLKVKFLSFGKCGYFNIWVFLSKIGMQL